MPIRNKKNNTTKYVLIIEDNAHHAELIIEILDRHFAPIIIHTVDSVVDGLEFTKQSSYDLILTDAVIGNSPITEYMPKLSKTAAETPIIVISGRGDESLAAKLIKLGASEYLSKTQETLENLSDYLEKHLKKGLKHRKSAIKEPNKMENSKRTPTPADIIKEVDQLTQQALALVGPKRGKSKRHTAEIGDLDRLLRSIKKLRDLALKLGN